jgi:hypothetical protein
MTDKTQLIKTDLSGCRILHLTLSKIPFEVMVTGEKQEEFRKNSDWIRSRLFEKEYDYIKFANGYGSDKPYFICKYEGFMECYMNVAERKYSNGLSITGIGKGDFIIYCGDIVERGNINGSHPTHHVTNYAKHN